MPGGTAPAPRDDYLRGPKELGDDMAAAELNGWLSKEPSPDELRNSREVKQEMGEEPPRWRALR